MKLWFLVSFIVLVGCQHQGSMKNSRDVASFSPFLRNFFKSIEHESNSLLTVSRMDEMTRSYLLKEGYDPILKKNVPNWKRAGLQSEDDVKNLKSVTDDVDNPNLKKIDDFVEREAHLIFPSLEQSVISRAYVAVNKNHSVYYNHFAPGGSATQNIINIRPNPSLSSNLGKSTDFYVLRLEKINPSLSKTMVEQTRFYAKLGKELNDPAIIANARRSAEAHARATELSGVQTFTKSCNVQEGRYLASKADVDVHFARRIEAESVKDSQGVGKVYRESMEKEISLTKVEAERAFCNLAINCDGFPKQMASVCRK